MLFELKVQLPVCLGVGRKGWKHLCSVWCSCPLLHSESLSHSPVQPVWRQTWGFWDFNFWHISVLAFKSAHFFMYCIDVTTESHLQWSWSSALRARPSASRCRWSVTADLPPDLPTSSACAPRLVWPGWVSAPPWSILTSLSPELV